MSKCSYCGATLAFIVEKWDFERGGAWWGYNKANGCWQSSKATDFEPFKELKDAEEFFMECLQHPHFFHLRIRKVVFYQDECVVQEFKRC
jgi:hypothetical protein